MTSEKEYTDIFEHSDIPLDVPLDKADDYRKRQQRSYDIEHVLTEQKMFNSEFKVLYKKEFEGFPHTLTTEENPAARTNMRARARARAMRIATYMHALHHPGVNPAAVHLLDGPNAAANAANVMDAIQEIHMHEMGMQHGLVPLPPHFAANPVPAALHHAALHHNHPFQIPGAGPAAGGMLHNALNIALNNAANDVEIVAVGAPPPPVANAANANPDGNAAAGGAPAAAAPAPAIDIAMPVDIPIRRRKVLHSTPIDLEMERAKSLVALRKTAKDPFSQGSFQILPEDVVMQILSWLTGESLRTRAMWSAMRSTLSSRQMQYIKGASMEKSKASFIERYRNQLFWHRETVTKKKTNLSQKLRRNVTFEEWQQNYLQKVTQKRNKREKRLALEKQMAEPKKVESVVVELDLDTDNDRMDEDPKPEEPKDWGCSSKMEADPECKMDCSSTPPANGKSGSNGISTEWDQIAVLRIDRCRSPIPTQVIISPKSEDTVHSTTPSPHSTPPSNTRGTHFGNIPQSVGRPQRQTEVAGDVNPKIRRAPATRRGRPMRFRTINKIHKSS